MISLVVGFVLANAISRLRPLWAGLAMLIVVVPHFISALVRTYGWIILLGDTRPGEPDADRPLGARSAVPAALQRDSAWSSAPPR